MIDVLHITKNYFDFVALNDVTFSIPRGGVLGVLGPNGAGKTTLIKVISGFLEPNSGKIVAQEGKWPTIGYKPERLLLPRKITVYNYLDTIAGLTNYKGAQRKEAVTNLLRQMNLQDHANKSTKALSKGMRQRLLLAQALMGNPDMLLLDEPTSGLDPSGKMAMLNFIRQLNQMGKTVVLNTHQLEEVKEICTHILVLKEGRVAYQNRMATAMSERTRLSIRVDRDLKAIKHVIEAMDDDIEVVGDEVFLGADALHLRRDILTMVLSARYDIVKVGERGETINEIYEAIVQ